jgi:hypothetical protein
MRHEQEGSQKSSSTPISGARQGARLPRLKPWGPARLPQKKLWPTATPGGLCPLREIPLDRPSGARFLCAAVTPGGLWPLGGIPVSGKPAAFGTVASSDRRTGVYSDDGQEEPAAGPNSRGTLSLGREIPRYTTCLAWPYPCLGIHQTDFGNLPGHCVDQAQLFKGFPTVRLPPGSVGYRRRYGSLKFWGPVQMAWHEMSQL